ncbi:hypothetical protein CCUS01_12121 [Colletotrichum cuscutae]|uniref:Uncharacterized protein n=1 Tax=Colletotrichum cuscutae TaxID=1209917 RepID=A0AAI9TZS3_9PEZI|nr:hypothetical protein CCUS01_12121 [Colletotrichum cuscutae]
MPSSSQKVSFKLSDEPKNGADESTILSHAKRLVDSGSVEELQTSKAEEPGGIQGPSRRTENFLQSEGMRRAGRKALPFNQLRCTLSFVAGAKMLLRVIMAPLRGRSNIDTTLEVGSNDDAQLVSRYTLDLLPKADSLRCCACEKPSKRPESFFSSCVILFAPPSNGYIISIGLVCNLVLVKGTTTNQSNCAHVRRYIPPFPSCQLGKDYQILESASLPPESIERVPLILKDDVFTGRRRDTGANIDGELGKDSWHKKFEQRRHLKFQLLVNLAGEISLANVERRRGQLVSMVWAGAALAKKLGRSGWRWLMIFEELFLICLWRILPSRHIIDPGFQHDATDAIERRTIVKIPLVDIKPKCPILSVCALCNLNSRSQIGWSDARGAKVIICCFCRAAWEKHRALVGQQRAEAACLLMLVAMGDSETKASRLGIASPLCHTLMPWNLLIFQRAGGQIRRAQSFDQESSWLPTVATKMKTDFRVKPPSDKPSLGRFIIAPPKLPGIDCCGCERKRALLTEEDIALCGVLRLKRGRNDPISSHPTRKAILSPLLSRYDDLTDASNVRIPSRYAKSEQLKRQLLTMAFVSLGTPLQFAWICPPHPIHNKISLSRLKKKQADLPGAIGGAIVSSGPGDTRAFLKPSNKEWIKSDEGTLAHMTVSQSEAAVEPGPPVLPSKNPHPSLDRFGSGVGHAAWLSIRIELKPPAQYSYIGRVARVEEKKQRRRRSETGCITLGSGRLTWPNFLVPHRPVSSLEALVVSWADGSDGDGGGVVEWSQRRCCTCRDGFGHGVAMIRLVRICHYRSGFAPIGTFSSDDLTAELNRSPSPTRLKKVNIWWFLSLRKGKFPALTTCGMRRGNAPGEFLPPVLPACLGNTPLSGGYRERTELSAPLFPAFSPLPFLGPDPLFHRRIKESNSEHVALPLTAEVQLRGPLSTKPTTYWAAAKVRKQRKMGLGCGRLTTAESYMEEGRKSDDYSVLVWPLTTLRTTTGSRFHDTLENPVCALLDDLDLGRLRFAGGRLVGAPNSGPSSCGNNAGQHSDTAARYVGYRHNQDSVELGTPDELLIHLEL